MRKYLFYLLIFGLIGCGASESDVVRGTVSPIQVRVVSWDHAAGEFRLSFALLDGPEAADNITAVSLQIFSIDDDQETAVWQGSATSFSDYEIPYWTAHPTVTEAGFWGVNAELNTTDGETIASDFIIEVVAESGSPLLGDVPPASQNKTLATESDLTKLSSGPDPNPAYYQLTVAEALAQDKPIVVGFITPGLCQTEWCAPVLGSVDSIREAVGDSANFIHIEVFDDFQALTLVPEMAEWGLDTREPWVFVLNQEGQVTAKFSGPLSPRELDEALRPLIE